MGQELLPGNIVTCGNTAGGPCHVFIIGNDGKGRVVMQAAGCILSPGVGYDEFIAVEAVYPNDLAYRLDGGKL